MDDRTGEILRIFEQISAIPRCSRQERRIADWLLQWAWFQWLKLNRRDTRVTIAEMARVVSVAMGQHIDPQAARQTSRRMAAEIIGVHPSTYAKKYEIMHSKLAAEIQFQESIASTAILTKMGGGL